MDQHTRELAHTYLGTRAAKGRRSRYGKLLSGAVQPFMAIIPCVIVPTDSAQLVETQGIQAVLPDANNLVLTPGVSAPTPADQVGRGRRQPEGPAKKRLRRSQHARLASLRNSFLPDPVDHTLFRLRMDTLVKNRLEIHEHNVVEKAKLSRAAAGNFRSYYTSLQTESGIVGPQGFWSMALVWIFLRFLDSPLECSMSMIASCLHWTADHLFQAYDYVDIFNGRSRRSKLRAAISHIGKCWNVPVGRQATFVAPHMCWFPCVKSWMRKTALVLHEWSPRGPYG